MLMQKHLRVICYMFDLHVLSYNLYQKLFRINKTIFIMSPISAVGLPSNSVYLEKGNPRVVCQNNVGHMKLMQQRTYIMYMYHGDRTFAIVRQKKTTLFSFK